MIVSKTIQWMHTPTHGGSMGAVETVVALLTLGKSPLSLQFCYFGSFTYVIDYFCFEVNFILFLS